MDFNLPPVISKSFIASKKVKASYYDMIVFSPIRWSFIHQRPQHMVSRLAKKRNVLFVEMPIEFKEEEHNTANLIVVNDQITVLQPKVEHIDQLVHLLPHYVSNDIVAIGLFYSPAFSPLLEIFTFDKVVYDCVCDAPINTQRSFDLREKEAHLIAEADLILANEKLIYDSKYQDHPNVHCLPSLTDQYSGATLPTAILDRAAERMEVLIRSCRNYGVLI
ncbi:MAG TPA: hypothetical protein VK750_05680 [Cytophagaceae bacterium]|jgi:hypothetical protein|nr:hypothetical protein [Cytophagaceae bacterium]